MAAHVVNPQQLSLFLDPVEHLANLTKSVDIHASGGSMSRLLARKLTEAKAPQRNADIVHGAGVFDSVARSGVINPVEVYIGPKGEDIQGEGHHRLVSAAAIQQQTGRHQYVPVEYSQIPIAPPRTGNTARVANRTPLAIQEAQRRT